jgi:hypothetical protein
MNRVALYRLNGKEWLHALAMAMATGPSSVFRVRWFMRKTLLGSRFTALARPALLGGPAASGGHVHDRLREFRSCLEQTLGGSRVEPDPYLLLGGARLASSSFRHRRLREIPMVATSSMVLRLRLRLFLPALPPHRKSDGFCIHGEFRRSDV